MNDNSEMKSEYDFSGAERGRFYRPDAEFQTPVYLASDSLAFVQEISRRKGTDISEVVNDLLKADRDLINRIQ